MKILGIVLLLAIGVVSLISAQTMGAHGFLTKEDMKWEDGPKSLPAGTAVARQWALGDQLREPCRRPAKEAVTIAKCLTGA